MKNRIKKFVTVLSLSLALALALPAAAANVAKIVETGVEYSGVYDAVKAATAGQTVKMLADSKESVLFYNKVLTLDLNGHVLRANGNYAVQVNAGSNVTIKDTDKSVVHNFKVGSDGLWTLTTDAKTVDFEDLTARPAENTVVAVKGGVITGTGASDSYARGIEVYGTNTLDHVNVIGNKSNNAGAGVYVGVGSGILNGEGCRICGNVSSGDSGGGVMNFSTVNLRNSKLSFNKCGNYGGGLDDNGAIKSATNNGTGTLTDCEVIGNEAKYGGGVHNGWKTILKGTTVIAGNTATTLGGGVSGYGYWGLGNAGQVTIDGRNVCITGNTCTANAALNNYAQETGYPINLTGGEALGSARIGIGQFKNDSGKKIDPPVAVTAAGTGSGTAADVAYFTSDDAAYVVVYNTDHLVLKIPDIKVQPTAVDNTTVVVTTNGVPVELVGGEYLVPSNSVNVKVVYTASNTCYFADGSTAKTNDVDTSTNPATLPAAPAAPTQHKHCLCGASGSAAHCAAAHTQTELIWKAWTSTTSLPTTADNWYLVNDVTLTAEQTLAANVNLCLNGHVVKQTTSGKRIATINSGATFQLTDCEQTVHKFTVGANYVWALNESGGTRSLTGGCLTGGSTAAGGAGIYNNGTFKMYAGNIVGNATTDYYDYYGGGVLTYGTFTMNGGTLIGNRAGYGGGVATRNTGWFNANGGKINENATPYQGGALCANGGFALANVEMCGNHADAGEGGAIHTWYDTGSAISSSVSNSVIVGNFAKTAGAIHLARQSLTLVDVVITNNTATTSDGAIQYNAKTVGQETTLILGGTTKIIDNKAAGVANNVGIVSGKTIILSTTTPLTSGAQIGVTTATAPVAGTPVAVTSNRGEDYTYFTSDAGYEVVNLNGVVKLAASVAAVISADGSTTNRFATLAGAYSAVANGETLKILADQIVNDFKIGKSITFDLGGKTITGHDVILVTSGATVMVTNGTICADTGASCCGVNDSKNGGSLYLEDVNLTGYNTHYGSGGDTYLGKGVVCSSTSLYSSNGSGRLHVVDGEYTFTVLDCKTTTPSTERLFISGGCYSYDSTTLRNYLKSGYTTTACVHGHAGHADVVFDDAHYVARLDHLVGSVIESTKFASVMDAVSAAVSGDTVVLMTNRTENVSVSGKAITLDLNSKTLTGTGAASAISVASGAGLVVTNASGFGWITTKGAASTVDGAAIASAGNLALYGVRIEDCATSGKGAVYVGGGTLTVGGDVYVNGNTNATGAANNIYLASGRKITISTAAPLAADAVLAVTTETIAATMDVTTNGAATDVDRFISDNPAYVVDYATDHVVLKCREQSVLSTSGFTGTAVGYPGAMEVFANLRAMPYSEVAALPDDTLVLFSSENPEGASWTSVPDGSAKLKICSLYDNNDEPRYSQTSTVYPYAYYEPYSLVKGVTVQEQGSGFDDCEEGSLSAYTMDQKQLAYFCYYGGARNVPGYAADFQIKKVDASTDYTVDARASYYDLYGQTEVDIREHVQILWGDVNISKGTVVEWVDSTATFTKDSTDAERTIKFTVNSATVTVVCPKILPPPTLLYTPVKDDVVYYQSGVGTVQVPWQEADVSEGKIVLATNKAVSAANALDNLLAPALTVDTDGKVTYALGELDGGEWYGYYLDEDGHMSKPVPFYMAPETECTLTLKTVDGGKFLDGTTETNIVYTHWTYTQPPPAVTNDNEAMLPIGWYSDPGHTNAFVFGERLTSNMTVYACWRVKTGIVPYYDGRDIAESLSGSGWSYDEWEHTVHCGEADDDYFMGYSTNTAFVVSENDYGELYTYNLTLDHRETGRVPLTVGPNNAYFYLCGSNALHSADGVSPLVVSNGYIWISTDDPASTFFLHPGAGAEPVQLLNGAQIYICTGTFNQESLRQYVYTPDHYYAFDNADGTWTAARGNWITYDLRGVGGTNFTEVVRYGKTFAPPADPSAEGYTFGGWCSDSACQNLYTEWKATAGSSQDYRITLYARWIKGITFDAAGGAFSNGLATCEMPIEFRSTYQLPAETPTRVGYSFLGWYAGVTNNAPEVTESKYYIALNAATVFAKWESTQIDPETPGAAVVAGDDTPDGLAVANVKPTVAYENGNVVIPDRTANDAGSKAIVSIADAAFTPAQYEEAIAGATPIRNVVIPTFVTEIGKYAFWNNRELETVIFSPAYDYKTGAPVEVYVKYYAFAETAITNVTFPVGGTYKLGSFAFAHNKMLKDVWILGDVTIDSMERKPFYEVGEGCGGTTFHLSPKKAADAAFVAALTNGVNNAVVNVSTNVAGSVELVAWDVTGDPIVAEFTLSADAPFKVVSTNTVSLLYSIDPDKLVIGDCTQIFATKVEKLAGDGSYRAEFPKPTGDVGYFTLCVGD